MSKLQAYTWNTPNGKKLAIALEEAGLPYDLHVVNIGAGQQHTPEFSKISPNHKIPILVDPSPSFGGGPVSIMESIVILRYIASQKLPAANNPIYPSDARSQIAVEEWLAFQIASIGPNMGNYFAFKGKGIEFGVEKFGNEVRRLFGVVEKRLEVVPFLAGAQFSIADIVNYCWMSAYEAFGIDGNEFPKVKDWLERVGAREGVKRGEEKLKIAVDAEKAKAAGGKL